MPEIRLTNGKVALVDKEDHDRVVSVGKWSEEHGYAVRQIRVGGRKGPARRIWMHWFVLDVVEEYPAIEVDHINHDGLDNRGANLRQATKSENQRGRVRNVGKKSSSYKGVFYDPSPRGKKPWRVKIRVDGVLKSCGRYATEKEAAEVYDQRATKLEQQSYLGNTPNSTRKESLMVSYNRVILAGNLTRDPELRFTNDGIPVCSFGLAVNQRRRGGEETPHFFDISAWRELGETVANFKKKGDPILVEGRLQFRSWEDRESGQKRSKVDVVADSVQFLGRAGGDDGNGNGGAPSGGQSRRGGGRSQGGQREEVDINEEDFEDIPFRALDAKRMTVRGVL